MRRLVAGVAGAAMAAAATVAEAMAAMAAMAAAAEHMDTTLLSSHIPFDKNSSKTIPILNILALHNNTNYHPLKIQ